MSVSRCPAAQACTCFFVSRLQVVASRAKIDGMKNPEDVPMTLNKLAAGFEEEAAVVCETNEDSDACSAATENAVTLRTAAVLVEEALSDDDE